MFASSERFLYRQENSVVTEGRLRVQLIELEAVGVCGELRNLLGVVGGD